MNRIAVLVTGLALAAASAGCGVPYVAGLSGQQTDACSAPADCPGATCTGGMCVATQVSLPGLALEILPVSSAPFGAGDSFLVDLDGKVPLAASDTNTMPFAPSFPISLPQPIAIRGGSIVVNPAMAMEPGCTLVGGSLPGKITFYPIAPFSGPSAPSVVATTTVASDMSNTFDADLVPSSANDLFDVYIEPSTVTGCNGGKAIPPVFIPATEIANPGALQITLPLVTTFKGTIAGFGGPADPASKWTADLVEPTRGLVISSQSLLMCSSGVCSFTLLVASTGQQVPILRLRPPDASQSDTSEPTIYWNLAGTPLDMAADFSAEGLLVQAVKVAGKVTNTAGTKGVPAVLSVQSTSLSGTVQQNASRRIDSQPTAADGSFELELPPGDYQIRAFPLDGSLAITDSTITVSPAASGGCMCGVKLPLSPKIAMKGTVTTPLGEPATSVQVGVTPSQLPAASYWTNTHALDAAAGQTSVTTTDDHGHFRLLVDPSSTDLAVKPDPGTGFPWLVRPGLSGAALTAELPLPLQSPAIFQGVVTDPTGAPVANAVINAWFPLTNASGTPTGTAVQLAQTSTGADGSYTLLLQPQIQ